MAVNRVDKSIEFMAEVHNDPSKDGIELDMYHFPVQTQEIGHIHLEDFIPKIFQKDGTIIHAKVHIIVEQVHQRRAKDFIERDFERSF